MRWRCHVLETEKILVSHRQPYDNTIIITMYRECYDIKRDVGILYTFFQPRALFQLRLFTRDNSWL